MSSPKRNNQEEHQGDLAVKTRSTTRRPKPYHVVFHNDDYTTMEFVVHVLKKFFNKESMEAQAIMLTVHLKGRGSAGNYPKDLAESKSAAVMAYSRENGFPLKVTAEPDGFDSEGDDE